LAVVLSANVSADTGYYGELTSNQAASIPSGAAGNPGPAVTVVEKTVKAGSYLVTAQTFGFSYAPNSGATCYFTSNGTESGWRTLNTSSDWSHLQGANILMLGKFTAAQDGTKIALSCIRGYSFTGGTSVYGTLTLAPVETIE
jgi:hypothetical protein